MNELEMKYNNQTPSYYPTFEKGLAQAHVVIELIDLSKNILYNNTPTDRAIRKLFAYTSAYLNRRYPLGMDYCDSCEYRLNKLQRISPEAKEICLNILVLIRQGKSAKEIFSLITDEKNNERVALPIPNLSNTKWIAEYEGKSYILEFEQPPIADLYEVDKETQKPNTNMICGIGYTREPNSIKFSGRTHLVPTANFIKGELSENRLYVYYNTLSPYREWITKELVFLPLCKVQSKVPSIVQYTQKETSVLLPSAVTTEPCVECGTITVETPKFEYCPIKENSGKTTNILKSIGLCLLALAGLALLIFILSKLFLLGFIILLGISMLFAKK